jgi:hypothetical protein
MPWVDALHSAAGQPLPTSQRETSFDRQRSGAEAQVRPAPILWQSRRGHRFDSRRGGGCFSTHAEWRVRAAATGESRCRRGRTPPATYAPTAAHMRTSGTQPVDWSLGPTAGTASSAQAKAEADTWNVVDENRVDHAGSLAPPN